ncbi:MAG: transcription-repair coupling factor [Spirochaetales bacterium]|nr:transcription-repair coupling factor [Spirochaetales bacterium]
MIGLFFNKVKALLNGHGPYRKLRSMAENRSLPVSIRGVERGFLPFLVSALREDMGEALLVIVPDEREAEDIREDLSLFLGDRVLFFPAWQNLPYADVPSQEAVFQERAKTLSLLPGPGGSVAVAPLRAALGLLPPPDFFARTVVAIERGGRLNTTEFERKLSALGYNRVPRVSLPGEFAVRGEVVDVFAPQEAKPWRVLLDFETIDALKEFDPVTQLSERPRDRMTVSPVHEYLITPTSSRAFLANAAAEGIGEEEAEELLRRLRDTPEEVGLEYYIPLFFPGAATLADYLPRDGLVLLVDEERLEAMAETVWREYRHQHRLAQGERKPVARPERLLAAYGPAYAERAAALRFGLRREGEEEKGSRSVSFACDPPRSYFGNLEYFEEEIDALIRAGYAIALFADYEAQAVRLSHILKGRPLEILPHRLGFGFGLPDLKIMVIVENEIFRRKKRIARVLRGAETEKIDSFIDLEEGDFVVHLRHGIGCFLGIERVKSSSFERDYIKIEYADKELLFLPVEQVNLIDRYVAPGGKRPRLDKIGGRSWKRRKEKVKRSVAELAERLLRLYSIRKNAPGYSFPKDTEWQEQFEAGFPYEETSDQLACIGDVKRDMEQPSPMDRLVCGDVGYGKTEIALRAAFKAVMGGKQVAVLAPTTILAEQHYGTFTERLERFPVRVKMLSRFVKRPEQKKTLDELGRNEVDVVIGTHRIVQNDVRFKNLGLLVVDEEQRFGVRHKERLKELKATVDCLTLSATPIPRTLYMSLMKIRDMSLLNTPPRNRLPIETFVEEWGRDVVERAVRREIGRGGQVFYLHNRIESIGEVHSMLASMFPELRIAAAHGRMESEELEDIMRDFIHGGYQMLLSTAIIENGIDIPNVNTIIIDRADMFGISQLYQLRGRVGRSDVPAFAYLLYPKRKALSERAMKRLKIISDFTELGSGFKIALKDLEMRGAGNLLGPEQHGDILAVGFEMYVKLLQEAMSAMETARNGEERYRGEEVFLELEYSGFIPDAYIPEPMEKMETYKQIASITTDEELEAVRARIEDRFGPLPKELESILSIAELRIICAKLAVNSLIERGGAVRIEFSNIPRISADKVVRLIRESGRAVFLKNSAPQCLFIKTGKIGLQEKSIYLRDKLQMLL